MSPEEAEKILNKYGGVMASLEEGKIVQDVSNLPYSPGKIRYAHFVYIEALIKEGLLTDKIAGELSSTYAALDSRFVEKSEEINVAWSHYKTDASAREIIDKHGGLTALMPSTERMIELHNFIVDCYGNWNKESSQSKKA